MIDVFITRPEREDEEELFHLFTSTISDAFVQDGIDVSHSNGIKEEVKKQMSFLRRDFESNGSDVFFLIARTENEIAGTIAYSRVSDLIRNNYKIGLQNIPEVQSVYVLPEFQCKGVGNFLFKEVLMQLKKKNIDEIVLDGGYKKSQRYWIKKLGNPVVTIKDYWGNGFDHMIWHGKLKDLQI